MADSLRPPRAEGSPAKKPRKARAAVAGEAAPKLEDAPDADGDANAAEVEGLTNDQGEPATTETPW